MFVYKNSEEPIYQQFCNDFEEKILKGEIIREQHIRKIEDLLQQLIEAAQLAGISDNELQKMLYILLGEK